MDESDLWNIINNDAQKKGITFEKPTFMANAMGFFYAVNWNERWIQAILVLQVLFFVLVAMTRHRQNIQSLLLVLLCASVYFAETLNKYGAENWASFSTQNYFDKNGIFVSVVFSAPLLLTGTFMMLYTLYSSAHMLVSVKRLELGIEKKKKSDPSKLDSSNVVDCTPKSQNAKKED